MEFLWETHVTEGKTHNLVIVLVLLQRHTVTRHLYSSTTRRAEKQVSFYLDLSEMRPVHFITSIMCHLKRPLRYGGYLSNQIQQNNYEMCEVYKGNECVDGVIAFARSAPELSDTIYQKRQLRCDHSVTNDRCPRS